MRKLFVVTNSKLAIQFKTRIIIGFVSRFQQLRRFYFVDSREMDETGRFSNGYSIDALPSSSNIPNKIITPEANLRGPIEAKEESATVGVVRVLLSALLSTVFKFKGIEEVSLLKELCNSIEKEIPNLKMDITELVDMFYEVQEENEAMSSVIATCQKRHANDSTSLEAPTPTASTNEMDVDPVAGPSGADKAAIEKRLRDERLKDLKPELICKVCFDNQVAVTFVPCGHLVTCVSCTAALFECPVCRAHIRGTIRTHL
ncbi:inhibitor of apoptosis protein-like [Watersipora subatra]|uniref:inhibitor of apoptosis protein-like n=1 Tax=Watersipora subatra TaxID=2589382 RepID=UPI00355BB514